MSTAVSSRPGGFFTGCFTVCKPSRSRYEPESDSEESDNDDELDELPPDFFQQAPKGPRMSVSAEAYGVWNVRKVFEPPVHPKTDEQKKRIKEVLSNSFMFTSLDGKDLESVIMAAEEVVINKGDRIIKQGDDGNHLYIVETGSLDCYKKFPDRETFNHIVKESAARKRDRYEAFLRSVPVFNPLDAYELSQVADALKTESFKNGDIIVQQGDPGDQFYLVESGTCEAFKNGKEKSVRDYAIGDYFGELALLRNAPRAATIKATSDATCLVIERRAFKRLLGSLEDLMARESKLYK
ncbi:hypothetical protein FOL47_002626 [Perkinsus chesapeaki]|uniref:Cyclic nucleotide-binding domain-containing protein n=1 Tax=Perkinsus chesapeaki TaxID=330153 RepID=A0A7J6MCX0_PERCH|nr:hypothetical protein FOL47_002626 [Perkinsus chesapeaki]